jgi:hypothetical protein
MKKRFESTLLLLIAVVILPAPAAAQNTQTKPYTVALIRTLLEGGFTGAEILAKLRTECIEFAVNAAAITELRNAGADDALINGLPTVCNRSGPQQRPGIVSIMGELPPGWQRTVNQLEPSANRQIELTPGRAAVIVLTAPGWCPQRTELTLTAGDSVPWVPNLRPRPWVGDCT